MTYLIEGELVREEKPDKYLNKFIDFKLTKRTFDKRIITTERTIITNSEGVAHWLNKVGYNLQWNDNLERTIEMCKRKKVDIHETKLFAPSSGWRSYLESKFIESKEERTVQATLRVWKETRLPTPWFYNISFGKLESVLIFGEDKSIAQPTPRSKKFTVGVIVDTPMIYLGIPFTYKKLIY